MHSQILSHLQSHLGSTQFQHNMRCVSVRVGHESKGHQLRDGRICARGAYVADFSFDNNREEFHAGKQS
jgi:hypothetical protein